MGVDTAEEAVIAVLATATPGQRYRFTLNGGHVITAKIIDQHGTDVVVDDADPLPPIFYTRRTRGGWIIPRWKIDTLAPAPTLTQTVAEILPKLVAGRRYRFAMRDQTTFAATYMERMGDALWLVHPDENNGAVLRDYPSPPHRGGHIVPLTALAAIRDVDEPLRRDLPKTDRMIYRLGIPIPYPTTPEEMRAVIVWFGERNHTSHMSTASSKTTYPTLDCASSVCRMVAALSDEQFACPDQWHLVYQPVSHGHPGGDCPTCGRDWIAGQL